MRFLFQVLSKKMQLLMNMSSVTFGITKRVLDAVKTLLLSAHTNVLKFISCFCNLISAVGMAKCLE